MDALKKSTTAAAIEPAENQAAPAAKPNPFDPATLRIDRNSAISSGPKELITRIGIGKPHKQDYIRVHPDPAYQVNTRVVLFKPNHDGVMPEPEWPPLPFAEILRIAFRDYNIDSPEHPIVKRLLGRG